MHVILESSSSFKTYNRVEIPGHCIDGVGEQFNVMLRTCVILCSIGLRLYYVVAAWARRPYTSLQRIQNTLLSRAAKVIDPCLR